MERKLKDSGIPWIGQIPEHWEIINLKRVCNLFNGDSISDAHKDSYNNPINSIPYIATKDVDLDSHIIDYNNGMWIKNNDKSFKRVPANTPILCIEGGSAGRKIGYTLQEICFVNKLACFDTIDRESNCSKFIYYFIQSSAFKYQFELNLSGLIGGVSLSLIKNFNIPVPHTSEQEAIAAYLDKKCGEIDELIEVEQQMISDLEAYRQAVITEAVTHGLNPDTPQKRSSIRGIEKIPVNWNEVNLLKVIYLRARLGWRGLKAEEYVDEGYPFLSAFNIVNNQLIWNNLNFINKQRYDESPEIKLSLHDILIVKDGAGIGKCARVKDMPFGESTVNSSLGVITVSDKLYYSYLFYFFLSTPFQDNVYFLKNGMGVPHLTQENLKSVRIPLPPVVEQKAIADYLDAKCTEIDDLIKVKQEKIETLKQYRQSLIFEAVTGKATIA